ncbi:MAG: alanine racemase [Armatimonadota bacterium]|nr:alanine racemase [Armatimonadota bacterium]
MTDRPTTYVAVDAEALAHNCRQVLGRIEGGARLMAVVKANAYGHGLVPASRVFLEAGASWLGVSSVAEGVALREAGIDAPVLVFMPAAPGECETLVEANLTATVAHSRHVTWLEQASEAVGRTARAHVFVDTGLSRMPADEPAIDIMDAGAGVGVKITGLYSHYGPPGSGAMAESLELFRTGVSARMFGALANDLLASANRTELLVHCAASALLLEEPETHLDMVRIGTLLYGQYPAQVTQRELDLQDTFELRSRVLHLGTVGVGGKIGYGGDFRARRETTIATVPVGYAHGLEMLPRSIASRPATALKGFIARVAGAWGRAGRLPTVRIRGREAPIIGRIAMDHCTVDVTDLPEVELGDEVVLPVRRTAVNPNIPRIYETVEEDTP